MSKYFSALFSIFLAYCSLTAQSFEEELRLFGAEDFFILENDKDSQTAQADENTEDIQDNLAQDGKQQIDSVQTAEAEKDGRIERPSESLRRQPVSSLSAGPMQVGGRGPVGDTSSVRISAFDTASVSQELSIDFSRNLSQYRSPQKALLYSLLLPGFGQAYNKKYWRTGLYAAIEIGMITGAVYFRRDAKKISAKAEKFADEHFDQSKLEKFYKELTQYGESQNWEEFNPEDVNIGEFIFGVFNDGSETDEYGAAIDGTFKYGYEKYLDAFNNDRYGTNYGVGSIFGVQGWDDATPGYSKDYPGFYYGDYTADTTYNYFRIMIDGKSVFGISQNQRTYNSMMDYSRKQSSRSSVFVVGIFVNHIASAADAFITAIIHNRKLLKEEEGKSTKAQDLLSRLSIHSDMYFDHDNVLTSKMGFVWRF